MKYVYQSLVVALFNAIAKTKKEAAEREAAEKSKDKVEGWLLGHLLYIISCESYNLFCIRSKFSFSKHGRLLCKLFIFDVYNAVGETTIHRTDVKQMTHENFLAMLKGQKEDTKAMEEFEAATSKTKVSKDERSKKGIPQAPSSSGAADPGASGTTWNALRDEYPLAGQSMALKVKTVCNFPNFSKLFKATSILIDTDTCVGKSMPQTLYPTS